MTKVLRDFISPPRLSPGSKKTGISVLTSVLGIRPGAGRISLRIGQEQAHSSMNTANRLKHMIQSLTKTEGFDSQPLPTLAADTAIGIAYIQVENE
ncbi:MAG: hypothetical protein ABSH47_10880 [Bryobacteraceae bacterium]|jgi:hypothetical protein